MGGNRMINNPFSRIIEVQGRMFQIKRILPESKIKMDEFEDWASLLKQYYHADTVLRANGQLWLCNEIKTIEYVEI